MSLNHRRKSRHSIHKNCSIKTTSGYEADSESVASTRPSSNQCNPPKKPHKLNNRSGDGNGCYWNESSRHDYWSTKASKHFLICSLPNHYYEHDFRYVKNLKIRPVQPGQGFVRMVLEPKFVDYGSIHTTVSNHQDNQHNSSNNIASSASTLSSHALLSPRSVHLPQIEEISSVARASSNINKMAQDSYQRQPLLPNTSKTDKWDSAHNSPTPDYYEEEDDDIMDKSNTERNGDVKIEMPVSREEPRFPQERCKTLLAAVIMCFNFILTLTSLSLVHERVPDREVVGPLPDVFLDNVPAYDWALDVSEYIIIVSVNTSMIALVFHKHRFIVFRRVFLIMSLLYMYRAVTMYITVLPLSSKTYPCSPKLNDTSPLVVMKRVVHLMSGFGLSVNGKHTYCGDFIYSGHTVVLVLSYLLIAEYTPKKFYLVHWLYWLMALVGVVMLQLSHGHYTVDVAIAYYVTTRLFWTYHTLANNSNLKQYSPNNLLSRSWWFTLFLYFEGNVGGPVPRQFNWPLPWPRRWQSKSRDS